MRTFPPFSRDADEPVKLQVYRTGDTLFIHRPSRFGLLFRKHFRAALIASLCVVLLCGVKILRDGCEVGDIFAIIYFSSLPFQLLFFLELPQAQSYLIRINATQIVFITGLFGSSSVKKIDRPDKLELSKHFNGEWLFNGLPKTCSFPAASHEIAWLRKVLSEFETKVGNRPPGDCVGDSRLESTEYRTLPPGGRQPTHSEVIPKESAKTIRSALRTMEYNGEPLVRVPHPSEEYAEESTPDGLFVRCPYCNAALPKENVWFEEAAGQCPRCRLVFQINNLKGRKPPKRCRIQFREDDTGLHLHQKPKHNNLLTVYLAALLPLLIFFYCFLLLPVWNVPMLLDPEVLRPVSVFALAMLALMFFACRTYHVHRYIDFGAETVRFRTRWLFFWTHRFSVARSEIGAFHGTFFTEFFGGVCLPYSANRSFYLCATGGDRDYCVNKVYRWLWHNNESREHNEVERPDDYIGNEKVGNRPPGDCVGDSRLESAEYRTLPPGGRQPTSHISGIGEDEREWQMFCPYCGRQFTGQELDFPHRESPIHCTECRQPFCLSEISRFIAEPLPHLDEASQYSLPEVPGLHAEQNGETLTVEYAPPLPTWGKLLGYFAPAIFLIVLFACPIALLAFTLTWDERAIRQLAGMSAMMLAYLPLLFMAFHGVLAYYDQYRCFYANWSIQIDRYRFAIHRQYKGESDMVTYDRRQIRKLCRNESVDRFASPLLGRFPSLLGNAGCGGLELVLADGTVELLPHLPLRYQNRSDQDASCRWVNYLNRRLVDR